MEVFDATTMVVEESEEGSSVLSLALLLLLLLLISVLSLLLPLLLSLASLLSLLLLRLLVAALDGRAPALDADGSNAATGREDAGGVVGGADCSVGRACSSNSGNTISSTAKVAIAASNTGPRRLDIVPVGWGGAAA